MEPGGQHEAEALHARAGQQEARRRRQTAQPGKDLPEVCRHLGIAESTWHRWKGQYGGMKANDAKRLKELENESGRLKRIVADLTLDNAMLKEVAKGNF